MQSIDIEFSFGGEDQCATPHNIIRDQDKHVTIFEPFIRKLSLNKPKVK